MEQNSLTTKTINQENVKRRRINRSKKKKNISIFYNNVRGAKSKYSSIKNILEQVKPSIIALCETKLGKYSKIKKIMPDYKPFQSITKQGKGGLLIGIRYNVFRSFVEVTSSEDKNILAVRVSVSDQMAYRIILAYGPQENDPIEMKERFMTELSVELQNCNDDSEIPILLGDFNAKLEGQNGVLSSLSGNGRSLYKLVNDFEMKVVNFSEVCKRKWTHEVRTTGEKSVLDYIITSKSFYKSITSMVIDEDCVFCPFSMKKKGKIPVEVFSDHNSIILEATVVVVPRKNDKKKQYKWKLLDEGKERLKELTSIENYRCPQRNENPQVQYDVFENEMNSLLKSTALRIKIKEKPDLSGKCPKRLLEVFKIITKIGARGKIQRQVASQYKQIILNLSKKEIRIERAKCLKEAITAITINGMFSRQQFWKVRKSINQRFETCSSVIDVNGYEVFEDELIVKAYANEFTSRLSHRKILPELSEYEKKTNMLAMMYIEESKYIKGPPIAMEELNRIIHNLKNGATGSDEIPTDFYTNIGEGFKIYLLEVLNELKNCSWIPYQWESTLIKTIYKNKGTRKILKNYRGIFLTQIISKMFEKIMITRKNDTMDKVTKFQAGSRANRGPLDNMFLLQSCIDHAKYMNIPLYVTVYDFSQCFDALWLEDCIVSLWKLGIRDETLSILFNMNEKAVVQVKTPVGISEKFCCKTIVKQGTVSGPPMCSSSTAEFVSLNQVRGFPLGITRVRTMVLMDDILNTNSTPDDVIKSHENMENFSHLKRLPLNGKKCFLLPINIKDLFKIPCVKYGGIKMEVVEKVLYLGNMFNAKGNNKDKIIDRVKLATACMIEALSLCSEITLGAYSIQSLLIAHSMMFIPTLLYGAQTWTNLSADDTKSLKTCQLKFLKRILRAPSGSCNSIVFMELGVLPIEHEINKMKLMFLYHILSLEVDDPVKTVYNEQIKFLDEKNWGNEVKALRKEYGLEQRDEEIMVMEREEWKNEVGRVAKYHAINRLNEEKNQLSNSSSYPDIIDLQASKYLAHFKVEDASFLFRVRCRIHPHIHGNDENCRCCDAQKESLSHILSECPELTSEPCSEGEEFSDDFNTLDKVITRFREFTEKVEVDVKIEEVEEV